MYGDWFIEHPTNFPSVFPALEKGDHDSSAGIGGEKQPSASQHAVKQEPKEEESDYDFDDMDVEELLDPLSNGPSTPQSHKCEYEATDLRGSIQAELAGSTSSQSSPPPSSLESTQDYLSLTASSDVSLTTPVPEIQLSPEQRYVLEKVRRGENVFFTGSAGTGKSVLLREIIKEKGGEASLQLAITALTGIASLNIRGCTLHSWAGIGLGKEDELVLVARIHGMWLKKYKEDEQRRSNLWRQKAEGVWLSHEDWAFLKKGMDETQQTSALDRWKNVKTLIIDESGYEFCSTYEMKVLLTKSFNA